jgi:hypothetical protein
MRRTFAIKAEVSDPWAETFAFGAQKTMYGGKHATDYAKARAKFGRGEMSGTQSRRIGVIGI